MNKELDKHCSECGNNMIIDEWNGWVWTCSYCDHVDRKATQKEIEKYEEAMNKIYKQID